MVKTPKEGEARGQVAQPTAGCREGFHISRTRWPLCSLRGPGGVSTCAQQAQGVPPASGRDWTQVGCVQPMRGAVGETGCRQTWGCRCALGCVCTPEHHHIARSLPTCQRKDPLANSLLADLPCFCQNRDFAGRARPQPPRCRGSGIWPRDAFASPLCSRKIVRFTGCVPQWPFAMCLLKKSVSFCINNKVLKMYFLK